MWEAPIHERLLRPAAQNSPTRPSTGSPAAARAVRGGRRLLLSAEGPRARVGRGDREKLLPDYELGPTPLTETEKRTRAVLTSAPPALSATTGVFSPRGAVPVQKSLFHAPLSAATNRVEVLREGHWGGWQRGGVDDEPIVDPESLQSTFSGIVVDPRAKDEAIEREVAKVWGDMGPDRWGPWKKRKHRRLDMSKVTIPVRQLRSAVEWTVEDEEAAELAQQQQQQLQQAGAMQLHMMQQQPGDQEAIVSPRQADPVLTRLERRLAELRKDPEKRRQLRKQVQINLKRQIAKRNGDSVTDYVGRNVELFEEGYHSAAQRQERLQEGARKRDQALERAAEIVERLEQLRTETAGQSRNTLEVMRAKHWAAVIAAQSRVEFLHGVVLAGRVRAREERKKRVAARRILGFFQNTRVCDPNLRTLRHLARIKVRMRHILSENSPKRRAADYIAMFFRDHGEKIKALREAREQRRLETCRRHVTNYLVCTRARMQLLLLLWNRTLLQVAQDSFSRAFRSARAGAQRLYVPDSLRDSVLRRALRRVRHEHSRAISHGRERHAAQRGAFTEESVRQLLAADDRSDADKLVNQGLHDTVQNKYKPPPLGLLRALGEGEMRDLISDAIKEHAQETGVRSPRGLPRK